MALTQICELCIGLLLCFRMCLGLHVVIIHDLTRLCANIVDLRATALIPFSCAGVEGGTSAGMKGGGRLGESGPKTLAAGGRSRRERDLRITAQAQERRPLRGGFVGGRAWPLHGEVGGSSSVIEPRFCRHLTSIEI